MFIVQTIYPEFYQNMFLKLRAEKEIWVRRMLLHVSKMLSSSVNKYCAVWVWLTEIIDDLKVKPLESMLKAGFKFKMAIKTIFHKNTRVIFSDSTV